MARRRLCPRVPLLRGRGRDRHPDRLEGSAVHREPAPEPRDRPGAQTRHHAIGGALRARENAVSEPRRDAHRPDAARRPLPGLLVHVARGRPARSRLQPIRHHRRYGGRRQGKACRMILDEIVAILGLEYRSNGDAARFERDLDGVAKKVEATSRDISRGLADFGDGLVEKLRPVALALGAAATAAGVALGEGVIDASSQWEGFEAALTTIEGSSEKAKASLDWISDFAKQTPYDLAGVTDSFIKLKSYGLDAADGTLKTLGDAASAMNKPLDQAVEAFADAASFQFERLREFGIVASQEGQKVTFQWTKDGKTVRETVKKTGDEVTRWLKNNFEGRFSGAMLRQSKTFGGMMSNLGDAWQDFQRRIGRGGFFDTVKNRLADLLDWIGRLDASGKLDEVSRRLSNGFTWLANQITTDVQNLIKVFGGTDLEGKIKPFLTVLGLLFARMFPIATAFSVAALAVEDWLSYMAGGDSVIGDFVKALADFLGADPQTVASTLGEIAKAAGWFAAAAVGLTLFASALRSLSGALVLLKGMQWAVGLLSSLAGISWTGAAAGAATAAGAGAGAGAAGAGAAGTAGGLAVSPAATVATGSAVLGAASMGVVGAMDTKKRRDLYDTPMAGAMGGDFALGAAFFDQAQENREAQMAGREVGARVRAWFQSEGVQSLIGGMRDGLAKFTPALPPPRDDLNAIVGRNEAFSIKRQFGVDPQRLAEVAKATLDITGFLAPANVAKAMLADLAVGFNAKGTLDLTQFNAAADQAEARLKRLNGGLSGSGGRFDGLGQSAVRPRPLVTAGPSLPTRPAVAQSPASP
ncbi:tape measure protein [Aureimonas leprariae]|uniref:Tape measure protein N-terminal domain-containing protein n=1 Tax=Plantimonas leprariae TaxID=2615207 RepID=A0A7V7TUN0_9HYPH|nr:tape measure protein [Aureimonas leprariae]KAB0676015.1 hypothetical protein F6X38_22400 [Aureimonas leprariae]